MPHPDADPGRLADLAERRAARRAELEAVNLAEQRAELRHALAAGTVPAGRLLGLPELPDGDIWCDIAGVSLLVDAAPSTITSWISRGRPSNNPFPPPDLRILYRDLWRRSTVQEWLDAGGSPFGRSPHQPRRRRGTDPPAAAPGGEQHRHRRRPRRDGQAHHGRTAQPRS